MSFYSDLVGLSHDIKVENGIRSYGSVDPQKKTGKPTNLGKTGNNNPRWKAEFLQREV